MRGPPLSSPPLSPPSVSPPDGPGVCRPQIGLGLKSSSHYSLPPRSHSGGGPVGSLLFCPSGSEGERGAHRAAAPAAAAAAAAVRCGDARAARCGDAGAVSAGVKACL